MRARIPNPVSNLLFLKTVLAVKTLLVCTFFLGNPALADTFYKWKNAEGVWNYGEHPPQGVEAIAVNTTSGRDNPSAAENPEDSDESGDTESTGEMEYFVTETAKVSKEEKDRLCKAAKANLETLESAAVIRKRDADGSVIEITDEERQTEIDNAKQTIKDFC